jgi:hypothetical protein
MYFNLIPNIEYDTKPLEYPFTKSDFVTAKNFFRRYEINPDIYNYSVYYNRYAVDGGETPASIADLTYGSPFYDWVVILTNNLINPLFEWPRSPAAVQKYAEKKYVNAYAPLYYETDEVKTDQYLIGDSTRRRVYNIALKGGLKVDENFYNSPFSYWDGSNTVTVPGSSVSHPVSGYDHEHKMNDNFREIYLLKANYLTQFVDEFKENNNYKRSSDFVSKRLKKTGVR